MRNWKRGHIALPAALAVAALAALLPQIGLAGGPGGNPCIDGCYEWAQTEEAQARTAQGDCDPPNTVCWEECIYFRIGSHQHQGTGNFGCFPPS